VADIFISYSKEHPQPTRDVAAFLKKEGYSVWWDTDLTAGEIFRARIEQELDAAKAVIVIWTLHSATSDWVISEAAHAARQKKLIPLRARDLDTWRIPKPYDARHTDVFDDFAAVLRAVRRVVGRGTDEAAALRQAEEDRRRKEEAAAFWRAKEEHRRNENAEALRRTVEERRRKEEAEAQRRAEEEHRRKEAEALKRAEDDAATGAEINVPKGKVPEPQSQRALMGFVFATIFGVSIFGWFANSRPDSAPTVTAAQPAPAAVRVATPERPPSSDATSPLPAADREACRELTGDDAISACTRAANSGRWQGHDLAIIYYNRGIEYARKSDYDRAISDYNEAIRLDPKYAFAYYNRGLVYNDQKNYDRAISDYNEAIRLDPKYAFAYYNRGLVYYIQKNYDRAISDYNEAIRLDPKYANAYRNRATAKQSKGDSTGANADFDEAARLEASTKK
jgi:tetratricopeptide (TPR) repeat protein